MTLSSDHGLERLEDTSSPTEHITSSDTMGKPSYSAASNGKVVVIHQELNEATVQFRRVRDNMLANVRNFEDLFYDTQTEFSKLTSLASEKEVDREDALRKLDIQRHKQEHSFSELAKKINEDLDELGKITKKNLNAVTRAIKETRELDKD